MPRAFRSSFVLLQELMHPRDIHDSPTLSSFSSAENPSICRSQAVPSLRSHRISMSPNRLSTTGLAQSSMAPAFCVLEIIRYAAIEGAGHGRTQTGQDTRWDTAPKRATGVNGLPGNGRARPQRLTPTASALAEQIAGQGHPPSTRCRRNIPHLNARSTAPQS